MIDMRIIQYPRCFGKCVLKSSGQLFYFHSLHRKSNGKFWMILQDMNRPIRFKRSLSLSDFSFLVLK